MTSGWIETAGKVMLSALLVVNVSLARNKTKKTEEPAATETVAIETLTGADKVLHDACRQGDLAAVTQALADGADIHKKDGSGNTALDGAYFCPEITKLLLDKGADPNAGSYPALIQAANCQSIEVLDMLLEKGADPNKQGVSVFDGTIAIKGMIATEKAKGKDANKTTLKIWEDMVKNAKPVTVKAKAIELVVQQTNCVYALKKLIEAGADVKAVDENGGTILHRFAVFGMTQQMRKELCQKGSPAIENFGIKVPDWYKNLDETRNGTPEEMLKVLLEQGLDLEAQDKTGHTPFQASLASGFSTKKEIMLALINAGANVNVEHEQEGKAITLATKTGQTEVVKAMLAKGADVNAESREMDHNFGQFVNGYTPLTIAAMMDDLPMVKTLIEAGAKIGEGVHGVNFNWKTNCVQRVKNKNAMFFALERANADMVNVLIDSGFDFKQGITINQLKQTHTSTVTMGKWKVTTTTSNCLSDGTYMPSKYAKKLELKELSELLKKKGF
jgi:ankyrin repeat protein